MRLFRDRFDTPWHQGWSLYKTDGYSQKVPLRCNKRDILKCKPNAYNLQLWDERETKKFYLRRSNIVILFVIQRSKGRKEEDKFWSETNDIYIYTYICRYIHMYISVRFFCRRAHGFAYMEFAACVPMYNRIFVVCP